MPDLIFNLSKSNVVYLSNENINLAIWEYFSLSSYFSTYCYYIKRILRNCLLGSQKRYKHTHSFVLLWYTHTTLNSEFVWIKIYYCYHIILLKQLSIALYSSSVQFSYSVVSDSLWPHGLQHPRPPCPSPNPGAYSNSCPLIQWCHPTISSSVTPFSSCFQSFPASGSFQTSQLFASGGQSIGASASASALPMHIQDWFPLGWIVWISLETYNSSG